MFPWFHYIIIYSNLGSTVKLLSNNIDIINWPKYLLVFAFLSAYKTDGKRKQKNK